MRHAIPDMRSFLENDIRFLSAVLTARPTTRKSPCALRSAGSAISPRSPTTSGSLRDALDDLGLVVEAIEHVGEGLERRRRRRGSLEIRPIKGADKIRLVVVDAGGPEPLEIVCGATNFEVGDRVRWPRSAPCCPGGLEIAGAPCAA